MRLQQHDKDTSAV